MICQSCRKEYPKNSVGFYMQQGFICMACENAVIDTFTVKYPGMGDCTFRYKHDALAFIEEDIKQGESKSEDYKIEDSKMKAMEYYDLDEWDG